MSAPSSPPRGSSWPSSPPSRGLPLLLPLVACLLLPSRGLPPPPLPWPASSSPPVACLPSPPVAFLLPSRGVPPPSLWRSSPSLPSVAFLALPLPVAFLPLSSLPWLSSPSSSLFRGFPPPLPPSRGFPPPPVPLSPCLRAVGEICSTGSCFLAHATERQSGRALPQRCEKVLRFPMICPLPRFAPGRFRGHNFVCPASGSSHLLARRAAQLTVTHRRLIAESFFSFASFFSVEAFAHSDTAHGTQVTTLTTKLRRLRPRSSRRLMNSATANCFTRLRAILVTAVPCSERYAAD